MTREIDNHPGGVMQDLSDDCRTAVIDIINTVSLVKGQLAGELPAWLLSVITLAPWE